VSVGDIISGGPLLLALPIAAAAGVVSFASPCMLPLVPGYLSYFTGLSGADLADPADPASPTDLADLAASRAGRPSDQVTDSRPASSPLSPQAGLGSTTGVLTRGPAPDQVAACEGPSRARGRVPLGAALFVLGFTAVFVAYGSALGTFGAVLRRHEGAVEQVLGALTVVLGLAFAGVLHWLPLATRQWRPRHRPAPGTCGAPVLGVLFAVSWTPCIGPTLAAVQALALTSASAQRGAVLSAAYSLGLGIPFVAVAFGVRRGLGALGLIRRHTRAVMVAGGALLVVTGLLEMTGEWNRLVIGLRLLFPSSTSSPL